MAEASAATTIQDMPVVRRIVVAALASAMGWDLPCSPTSLHWVPAKNVGNGKSIVVAALASAMGGAIPMGKGPFSPDSVLIQLPAL